MQTFADWLTGLSVHRNLLRVIRDWGDGGGGGGGIRQTLSKFGLMKSCGGSRRLSRCLTNSGPIVGINVGGFGFDPPKL